MLTGGSSFAVILMAMIRSKVIAVCVGPSGIGLFGILTSAISLAVTVAGVGINKSGVRQVAAATATEDRKQIGRTVYTLRRTSLLSGLLGTLLVALLSKPIARLTTGSTEYWPYLLILAPMVLFASVNGAQMAVLRGLGKIANLARLNVFGAVVGTLVASVLVWRWGLDGIAPAILATAGAALLASWLYARRVNVQKTSLTRPELFTEMRGLLGLGFAFLFTGLLGSFLHLALRAILLRQSDLYTVGQFVAAMALSVVYSDFVLQAMGLDYLPRLTRSMDDTRACNSLVNEQSEIALLVGGPGVVGFVMFAPVLIPLLYSNRFTEAVDVFQWQSLGVILQLASWPIGTVFLARGMKTHYIVTMSLLNSFYLVCFFYLVKFFGLTGAALSFALAHAFYLIMVLLLVRRITGFEMSTGSRRVILATGMAYSVGLASKTWLSPPWSELAAIFLLACFATWAYRELCHRLGMSVARVIADRAIALVRAAAPLGDR